MIHTLDFEGVRQYRMGHETGGQVAYWCAAYYWDGLLIDSGCPFCADELALELEGKPLRQVVNTHYHEDHIGANALLARDRGVELLAPEESLNLLANGFPLAPYREMIWGSPQPSLAQPLGERVKGRDFTLQVAPAPGHTPDQVIFFEAERGFAFVGDAWIGEGAKTARREERYPQILESLKMLRGLGPRVMFNGLGTIVEDASQALDRTIAFLEDTSRKILRLHQEGVSAKTIVDRLFGRESSLAGVTGGEMSYRNFVASFITSS